MWQRLIALFLEWRRKRRWSPSRQLAHMRIEMQTDERWLSHDPLARALIERYLRMLADDWERQWSEDISNFRQRVGLEPHYNNAGRQQSKIEVTCVESPVPSYCAGIIDETQKRGDE